MILRQALLALNPALIVIRAMISGEEPLNRILHLSPRVLDHYFLNFDKAKQAKLEIDFDAHPLAPTPSQLWVNVVDNVTLEDIVSCIDWNLRGHPKFLMMKQSEKKARNFLRKL